MSFQGRLEKLDNKALQEASDKLAHNVDTLGGCACGELGASMRANVPVPGMSKVAPATYVTFSMGSSGASGKTKGQLQSARLGSRYGPGVAAPAWLMKV
mmetsp:Transcript_53842/g.121316  ORF Transcript_53842/g.121316 Transcript_53842/m.121316 type:complete len:99 (+) Transcript_53842:84-380(+)